MSSVASSPIFHADWFTYAGGYYRLYEPDHPDFTVAFFYHEYFGDYWVFDRVNCSDDFLLNVIFHGGPLSDAVLVNSQLFRSGGPQAAQHSYPLDITVLTDTDDLPF